MTLNIKHEVSVPVGEQSTADSELLFQLTFENAAVGIAHVGRDGHFIRINNKLSKITGYPKDELIKKTFQEITHPDDLENDLKYAEELLKGTINSYSMEKRYFRKDGSIVWIKLTGSAVFHANGDFNVFIAIIEDISEQKKLEYTLRKSEDKFSKLFYNSAGFMATTDIENGKFIEVNDSFCRLTGYSREELVGYSSTELGIISVESRTRLVGEIVKNGRIELIEIQLTGRNGEIHDVLYSAEIISLNGDSFILTSGINVSLHKKAEEALQESEKRFKLAVNAAKIGTYSRNLKTGEDKWSPEFLAIFGYGPDEELPIKNGIPAAVHPDDLNDVIAEFQARLNRLINPEFNSEHRIVLPDGKVRWVSIRGRIDFDEDNNPLQTHGVAMDISERKQAEEALRHKIEENEKLLEVLPAAIWISEDPSCNHIRGNRMANDFYEAGNDENVSANVTSARRFFRDGRELSPEELPMQKAAMENKQVMNAAVDVLLPSGRRLHMHGSAIPLNNETGNVRGAIGAFVDITKHVETEKALRESEEKFRLLANNMSQLAWMMDNKGWVYWFNQRWYDYTGTSHEEMQGWGWQKVHHPGHINRVLKSKNHALESGEVWEEHFPLRSKKGEYRWFLTRAVPLKNEEGNIIRWLGTNTDVTHQRIIEKRLKNDSKLFKDLLYISAHDLKGPVANMYGALDLMDKLPLEKKVMFLNRFRDLADQLNVTIKGVSDILHMRNIDKSAASVVNIEKLLDKILLEFSNPLNEFSIERNIEKPVVSYVELFLYSVIKNLVSNAIKYCQENVPLNIQIATQVKDEYTLLSICDNGIGIDLEKYGEKLFSPFHRFSAKKANGTGVGLYLVKDIIEQNGGYIEVESTPEKGTTFYCYLKEY